MTSLRHMFSRSGLTLASCALLLAGCGRGGDQADPRAAFIPKADLVVYADVEHINASAFAKAMATYEKQDEKKLPPELQEILDVLKIEQGDISDAAFSIGNLSAMSNQDWSQFSAVAGFAVKKEITEAMMMEVFGKIEDPEAPFAQYQQEHYLNGTIFNSSTGDIPFTLSLGLIPGSKTLFLLGDQASVKQAILRNSEGEQASGGALSSAHDAKLDEQQSWMMLNLPPQAQAQLKQNTTNPQAAMFLGPQAASLASLSQIGWSANATDALELNIRLTLGNDADAQGVKTIVDNLVNNMGKMMSQQQFGKVLNVMNMLSTETQGNFVTLKTAITQEDIAAINAKAASMMPTPEGMLPSPAN